MNPLLNLTSVTTGYGRTEILHSIDLVVGKGEMVSLIGANGAGKSTLLLATMGLLPTRRGAVRLDGHDVAAMAPRDIVRHGMVLVPERRQLFSGMSVDENLRLGSHVNANRGDIARGLEAQFNRFPRLAERRRQPVETLSGGEQQMVALGRALMSQPRMLLLDEPSLGLAPIIVREVMDFIIAFRAEGGTVLLVEQNARAALAHTDRGYILDSGRILRSGTSDELLAGSDLLTAYLGADSDMELRLNKAKGARVRL